MDDRSVGRRTARTGRRTPGHRATRRPGPVRPATSVTPAAGPPPIATPDRLQYETRWPRSLLAQGFETIVPVQSLFGRLATPRVFQVEVARCEIRGRGRFVTGRVVIGSRIGGAKPPGMEVSGPAALTPWQRRGPGVIRRRWFR